MPRYYDLLGAMMECGLPFGERNWRRGQDFNLIALAKPAATIQT